MIAVEEIDYMPEFIEEVRALRADTIQLFSGREHWPIKMASHFTRTLWHAIQFGTLSILRRRLRRSFWLSELQGIRRSTSESSAVAPIESFNSRLVRYWL
jgi:hypothetical protein